MTQADGWFVQAHQPSSADRSAMPGPKHTRSLSASIQRLDLESPTVRESTCRDECASAILLLQQEGGT